MINFLPFLFLSINTSAVTLTPQQVVDYVLANSKEIKEIELTQKEAETAFGKSFTDLDWVVNSEVGFEDSQADTLQAFNNERDKTLSFNLGFTKQFQTGTLLKFTYSRQSRDSILNPLVTSQNPNFPSVTNLDVISLRLEQELWKNSFGQKDRNTINIGRLRAEQSVLEKLESVEGLILATLQAYWDTYVAKENLEAEMASRDRYKELVKTVRAKKKLGYSNPGELSQALAELEDQEQKVKLAATEYLYRTEEVYRQLQIEPKDEEVEFVIAEELPQLPAEKEIPVLSLRRGQSLIISQKIADYEFKNAEADVSPSLKLVAQSSYSGADKDPGEAWSRAASGQRPVNFVGINIEHKLFSRSNEAARVEKYYVKEKAKIIKDKDLQTLNNKIRNAYRVVKASKMVAESSIEGLKHRQQASREIESAFKQGRSEISTLIQVLNSLSTAHTKKIRSVGDYHISLNELAELRDQLVSSKPGNRKESTHE